MTLPTGTVTGWFSARSADADVSVPLSGTLEFTPLDRYTVDLESGVAGVMFSKPVTVALDAFGWLSEAGVREVELLAGRYVVTPSLFLEGEPYDLRAFPITVLADESVEIARETPSPDPGGIPPFRGLPPGGELGDFLVRSGPGDYEVAWAAGSSAPPASSPAAATYHVETPAATWTLQVPASLGRRPIVAIYDQDGAEVHADVSSTTETVTITFARPFAGYAELR